MTNDSEAQLGRELLGFVNYDSVITTGLAVQLYQSPYTLAAGCELYPSSMDLFRPYVTEPGQSNAKLDVGKFT